MIRDKRIGLEEKVIAITGGYGHLGAGMTEALLNHGAEVVVLGRSEEKFKAVHQRSESDPALSFRICDIGDTGSVAQALKWIVKEKGRLDVLVNNAVFGKAQIPEKMTDEEWKQGVDGTLNSVFRCIRESLPYLTNGGRIINISSMYGTVSPDFSIYDEYPAFLNPPNYGASKAGVQQLTRYFASYLGQKGITVNCISPGPFPSPEVQKNPGFIRQLEARTALKRIGKPEDLGGICVFLSSDSSSYITGQNIQVDGGWTII